MLCLPTPQVGSAVFETVCNGCSSVPYSVPGGVDDDSSWVIPVCEEAPKGALAPSNGTRTQLLTLEKDTTAAPNIQQKLSSATDLKPAQEATSLENTARSATGVHVRKSCRGLELAVRYAKDIYIFLEEDMSK